MAKIIARDALMANELNLKGVHPVLQRIYRNRGVQLAEQLQLDLKQLLSYDNLLGLEAAVACLYEALLVQKRIMIVGDFDVDGATSTALAIQVLRAFGFENVIYLVPSRFEHGYGLSPEVAVAAARETPNLLITVDNGISSHEGVEAAKKLGMEVIITDHHLAGKTLPKARAIVNPNQPGDEFASKNLAGVGVVFYLLLALRAKLRDENWFAAQNIPEPNMANYLDLVALGTVADIVTLDKNNRILVRHGLQRICSGNCVPGIKALLTVAKRDFSKVVANDLSFVIAPRLNAAGRLDDMGLGIDCLLENDEEKAREIAIQLDLLNDERKLIETNMQKQVANDLDLADFDLNKALPKCVCLYNEKWHQGVVGLLASRIKEKINRPVIAFAKVKEGEIKGSARSINGLHIRNVLENVISNNPGLVTKFGGHAMAAGVNLTLDNYEKFCQIFTEAVNNEITEDDLCKKIYTDGQLRPAEITLEMAQLLRDAGPWGEGFLEPCFDGVFDIVQQTIVGKKHLKLVLAVPGSSYLLNAIAFNVDLAKWPNEQKDRLTAVYRLDINDYKDRKTLQLIIEHLE